MSDKLKIPSLFIIVGLPGSGKTQLARSLAKKLGVYKIHADKIRGDLPIRSESSAADQLVNKIALLMTEEFARLKMSVICDVSAQTRLQRQAFYKLGEKYKMPTIIIYQQIDRQVSWLRYQGRKNARGKSLSLSQKRQLFRAATLCLEPPIKEKAIIVSGVHTLDVQLQVILCKLLEMQLLSNKSPQLKKIAKPGLVNLVASNYKNPLSSVLPINLNTNLTLSEEN